MGKIKKAKSQVHSGSLLLGAMGGVLLLWAYQEYQRTTARAKTSRLRPRRRVSPRPQRVRSLAIPHTVSKQYGKPILVI